MLEVGGYRDLQTLHRGQRSLILRARRLSDDLPVVIKAAAAEFPSSVDLRRLRHEFDMGQRAACRWGRAWRWYSTTSTERHFRG
jgi:hypothetical protein